MGLFDFFKRKQSLPAEDVGPSPANKLLTHFDRITGTEPTFARVSDDGAQPRLHVATYRGFPAANALTGFTFGLSHSHLPDGSHKELLISMLDTNDAWSLACGFVACQFHDRCSFSCGETINFKDRISPSSRMTAFVVVHPQHISPNEWLVDIGIRQVELVQLIPLYEQERSWLFDGGDLERFLNQYGPSEIMNPNRREFVP